MDKTIRDLVKRINSVRKDVVQLQKRDQTPQNMKTRVYNDSGAQIDAGKVVYASGVDSGRPEISLASNAAAGTYDSVIGVVPYDIANGASGYVLRYGYVRDIDTSAWAAGDELYLTAAGAMTNVRPVAPAIAIYIGSVITVGVSDGVIFVNPSGGSAAGGGGGGGGWENITLWHSGAVTEYAFSEAGLIAANAAAVSGDVVFITAGTITLTAGISIGAGVSWIGQSREETILYHDGSVNTLITLGAASVLSDLTVDFTTDATGSSYAVRINESICRNLNINASEDGSEIGTYNLRGLYGELYFVEDDTVCSLDSVSVYVESTSNTYHDSLRAIWVWINSANPCTVMIRDCDANVYSTHGYDTVYAFTAENYAAGGKLKLIDCTVYTLSEEEGSFLDFTNGFTINAFAAGGDVECTDCYAYCSAPNCARSQWAFYSLYAHLINCRGYASCDGAGQNAYAVGLYGDSDSELHGCYGVGEGSDLSYGLHALATIYCYKSVFSGDTASMFNDHATEPVYLSGCTYDDYDDDGGGFYPMSGDLSGIGINLWNSDGYIIGRYPLNEAGLIAANTAASSGDIVRIPPGTITLTAGISIAAGVEWQGMSRDRSILTANADLGNQAITLTTGSKLSNLTFNFNDARSGAGNTRVLDCSASYLENIELNITADGNAGGLVGIDMINATGLIMKNVDVNITDILDDIGVLQAVAIDVNTADNKFLIEDIKIYMEIDFDTDCEGLTVYAEATNPSTVINADIYMICNADSANVRGINTPSYTKFIGCKSHVVSADGYDCILYALDNDDYEGNDYSRCDFRTTYSGAGGSGEAYAAFVDTEATFEFCTFWVDGDGTYDAGWTYGVYTDAIATVKNSIIVADTNGYDLYVNSATTYVVNLAYDHSNSAVWGTLIYLPSDHPSLRANNTFTGNNTFEGITVFNESGGTTADVRAETDTEINMLFIDASGDVMYLGGSTNGVQINKGGEWSLIGTATRYEDLQVSISNIRVPTSNAPTERLYAAGIGGGVTFPFLGFDVNEYIYFDVQTSHAAKLNEALDNHIHYTLPNTTNIGDRFQFQLDVIAAGINTQWAVPAGSPYTAEKQVAANDDTYHRIMDIADIASSNDTVSTIYKCKLTRIAATVDEYGSEVYMTFTDCHQVIDTPGGSAQESSKT